MRLDFPRPEPNRSSTTRYDAETLEIEPSLEAAAPELAGAILHTIDGHGDAHLFCREMEAALRAGGCHVPLQHPGPGFRKRARRGFGPSTPTPDPSKAMHSCWPPPGTALNWVVPWECDSPFAPPRDTPSPSISSEECEHPKSAGRRRQSPYRAHSPRQTDYAWRARRNSQALTNVSHRAGSGT